ncbi:hypothetical protein V1508DRAFT_131685, partial [Lipomyces doorenjongii]|uniref:uncharacterized protein n=1 Tax=Lipomyces doorenjongii TaxID=383834 RepID=UPI0034CD3AF7
MSSEIAVYQCTKCNHEPFDSKAKLTKHISNYHREATTITYKGKEYPLIIGSNSNYVCPTCKNEYSSISNLTYHLNRHCHSSNSFNIPATNTSHSDNSLNQSGMSEDITVRSTITEADSVAGLVFNSVWNIFICKRCCRVVDKSGMARHLTRVHKLTISNLDTMLTTLRSYNVRAHLAVIWDQRIEEDLDDSDGDSAWQETFKEVAFRPGSRAIDGIPVYDGFK